MSFNNYKEAFIKESEYREGIQFDKLCSYGIAPLDDAMLAIAKNELVVIAAGSGYGKTELALSISRHNAMKGRKVAHYNLEGGMREAIARMKWRDMCDKYFDEYSEMGIDLDYRTWVLNKNPHSLYKKLESEVYVELVDKLGGNLFLYSDPQGLNCTDFCASLMDFHSLETAFEAMMDDTAQRKGFDLDLIVIDHLHYFSLDKDEDEIKEITAILREAKNITEQYGIPVVLVAHLRKLPRGHGMPDKEDIYGTSNIHKIANTCIILSPDHEKDRGWEGKYPTYMRIAKSRQGIRPNDLIYTDFDIKTRAYSNKYQIFKSFPDGSISPDPTPKEQLPKWCQKKDLLGTMVV